MYRYSFVVYERVRYGFSFFGELKSCGNFLEDKLLQICIFHRDVLGDEMLIYCVNDARCCFT